MYSLHTQHTRVRVVLISKCCLFCHHVVPLDRFTPSDFFGYVQLAPILLATLVLRCHRSVAQFIPSCVGYQSHRCQVQFTDIASFQQVSLRDFHDQLGWHKILSEVADAPGHLFLNSRMSQPSQLCQSLYTCIELNVAHTSMHSFFPNRLSLWVLQVVKRVHTVCPQVSTACAGKIRAASHMPMHISSTISFRSLRILHTRDTLCLHYFQVYNVHGSFMLWLFNVYRSGQLARHFVVALQFKSNPSLIRIFFSSEQEVAGSFCFRPDTVFSARSVITVQFFGFSPHF